VIALFQIGLPSELLITQETRQQLTGLEVTTDGVPETLGDVQVILEPPYRSRLSSQDTARPLETDPNAFNPVDPQPVDTDVKVNGVAAIRCDAIAVRIIGEEFERPRDTPPNEWIFPLLDVAIDAVYGLLERLRVLSRAAHLRPLERESTSFRLVFLDDSGDLVPQDEGLVRDTNFAGFRVEHVAVTPPRFGKAAVALGDYEIPPWDELLLDAMSLDVELGPCLVLAATAVETRIANALDVLAAGELSEDCGRGFATAKGST
jgi:hypothetical protein